MRLYLRCRRAAWVAAGMLSAGAVVGLAGETGVPVPNLAGGPGYGTVLALLAPAPTVAILAGGLAGRRLPGELAAARLVRLLDLVWVVIGVAWFALAATATDLAGTRDAAVRNLGGSPGSCCSRIGTCRTVRLPQSPRHTRWSARRLVRHATRRGGPGSSVLQRIELLS